MNPEDWAQIRAAFEALREVPIEDRARALAEDIEIEERLEPELMRLLEADAPADSFLTPPSDQTLEQRSPTSGDRLPDPDSSRLGSKIAGFELQRLIASGGMGAVYEAAQEVPRRQVAFKMIRGELVSPSMLQRFRHEVEVLARLQHPGIAQIFEAGVAEAEGQHKEQPWFAMELLEGAVSICDYAKAEGLTKEAKIRLFVQICDAVQHGHQRGVIHRDLKPANILIDAHGRPKVIDFGVARTTDLDRATMRGLTGEGELVGTLLYMSPEQVEKGAEHVDVRSDVYSLGIILFELLCGEHPFPIEGNSISEICKDFKDREVACPSSFDRTMPRDLDWIVQKALATEPDERYASPRDLALDLTRMLAHEPVLAGPPTASYRLKKFVRRHRVGVLATSLVALALLIGLVATSLALVRATRAEMLAEHQREVAVEERNRALAAMDFLVEVFSRANPAKGAREVGMVEALDLVAKIFRTRFAKQPDIEALIARMLGQTYRGLGLAKEGEQYLTEALDMCTKQHGADHVETAKVMIDLIVLRLEQGKLDEAEQLIARALPVLSDELGRESREALTLRVQKGDLLRLRGKPQEAEATLRLVVADMSKALGNNARQTLLAKNLLAGMFHQRGNIKEAEPLYREAMAGLAISMSEDHPDTLSAKYNFAMLMFSRGKRAEGIRLMRPVEKTTARVLGGKHRYTMRARSSLGAMLHLEGKIAEALPYYYSALEAVPKLERTSPDVVALRSNIGRLELDLGNFDKAEPIIRDVWNIRRKKGDAHPKALISHNEMADLELARGKPKKAEELYASGLRLVEAKYPAEHPLTYRFNLGLGKAKAALEDFEAAQKHLLRALEIFEAADKQSAVRGKLKNPKSVIAAMYEAWGKPGEAAKYR